MAHRIFTTSVASVYPHYLDKLVDELAKGKPMAKVLRS
jgi:hypothetical protein